MKYFLQLVLTGTMISFSALSQQYQPFPAESASWKVIRCFSFFPAGWYDVFTYSMSEDTVQNGIVYKKIIETVHHLPGTQYDTIYSHYFGALREKNKQIRMVSEWATGDTIERILYDFSVQQEGEWIYTNLLTYGEPVTIKSLAGTIDSIEIAGSFHRRIQIKNADGYSTGESWIEGVGSTFGLIYSGFYVVTDNSYDLRCFSMPSVEFTNNDLNLGFCLSTPQVSCDFSTSIPVISAPCSLQVYPNPVTDKLYLINNIPSLQIRSIALFDATGRMLLYNIVSNNEYQHLEVASLPRGICYLMITGHDGSSINVPLVLQ